MSAGTRITRILLSVSLFLGALLASKLGNNLKDEINIYGVDGRLDTYAQYISLVWVLIIATIVSLVWALENTLNRNK